MSFLSGVLLGVVGATVAWAAIFVRFMKQQTREVKKHISKVDELIDDTRTPSHPQIRIVK